MLQKMAEMTIEEFINRLWKLTDDALDDNSVADVLGMLLFIRESWMNQLFKAIDYQERLDEEYMFQ